MGYEQKTRQRKAQGGLQMQQAPTPVNRDAWYASEPRGMRRTHPSHLSAKQKRAPSPRLTPFVVTRCDRARFNTVCSCSKSRRVATSCPACSVLFQEASPSDTSTSTRPYVVSISLKAVCGRVALAVDGNSVTVGGFSLPSVPMHNISPPSPELSQSVRR